MPLARRASACFLRSFSGSEGTRTGTRCFGTPRHDWVSDILDLGKGRFLVAGTQDGPITHDGDHDRSLLRQSGYVDTFRVESQPRTETCAASRP